MFKSDYVFRTISSSHIKKKWPCDISYFFKNLQLVRVRKSVRVPRIIIITTTASGDRKMWKGNVFSSTPNGRACLVSESSRRVVSSGCFAVLGVASSNPERNFWLISVSQTATGPLRKHSVCAKCPWLVCTAASEQWNYRVFDRRTKRSFFSPPLYYAYVLITLFGYCVGSKHRPVVVRLHSHSASAVWTAIVFRLV